MPKRLGHSQRSLTCGRLTGSNKRCDAPQTIAMVSLLICLTIPIPQIRCSSDVADTLDNATTSGWLEALNTNADSQLLGENLTSEQKSLMSTRLPRQHFRLNVPAASKSNFKLVKIQRSRATKKPAPTSAMTTAISSTTTPMPKQVQRLDGEKVTPKSRPFSEKKLPKGQGKKISSALLRKLLSQTLPKLDAPNSNLANATENKGPGFKFVFIQRSTQPTASASVGSPSEPTKTRQPSLAANVSRQIAHSLLYSAASLVGNLSSVSSASGATLMPSLSALAPFSHQPSDLSNELATSSSATSSTSISSSGPESNNVAAAASEQQQSSSIKSKPTRRPRPSKIYNLPVKFVANGQPNHVMFHSIKQHFATIKRLQQSVSAQSPTSPASGATKRKKTHGQYERTRLKGKNSRLIHLPLKYLSNARPNLVNVIMGTKASHKSGSTLSGTPGSPP